MGLLLDKMGNGVILLVDILGWVERGLRMFLKLARELTLAPFVITLILIVGTVIFIAYVRYEIRSRWRNPAAF
jgi:hypothetical protein